MEEKYQSKKNACNHSQECKRKAKAFGKFTPYPCHHPMLINVIIAKVILSSKELQI